MKKNMLAIVPDFYPSNTGFAIAFKNLYTTLIDQEKINKIYVITTNPRGKSIPGYEDKIIVKYLFDLPRGQKILYNISPFILRLYYKLISIKIISKLRKIIKEEKIDFIFIESILLGWLAFNLEKSTGLKVITRFHGTGPEYGTRTKTMAFRKISIDEVFKTSFIATTTHFYIDFFEKYFNNYEKFYDKKFFIIPNTLKIEKKVELNKMEKSLKIIQLGRMDKSGFHQKGFEDTIEAFLYLEKILDKEMLKKISFISIGTGEKEEEYKEILKKIKYINIEHYSSLPNEKVQKKLEESNICLIPSRTEGMSMFATEAMALGKVFIFTYGNGMKDMIFNDFNGKGIQSYNYLELAEKIQYFLEKPNKIEEFSQNSLKLFEKEFSNRTVANKFSVMLDFIK